MFASVYSRRFLGGRSFASEAKSSSVKRVTVVGAGLMGSGIAQVSASSGFKVTLVDVNEAVLKKGFESIQANLKRVASKKFAQDAGAAESFVQTAVQNISLSTDAALAASKSDLVVEAVVENLALKHKLWKAIDSACSPSTLFASNTSSLSIEEIAQAVSSPGRFGGLHFFNPVPVMKLVEVVQAPATTDATVKELTAFSQDLGKVVVPCRDTPGFVVNRLLVPYMMEALRLVERGDAQAKDVDNAMKLGAGYPMGPFELFDFVGLDTTKFIMDGWSQKEPNNPLFAQSKMLNDLVAKGHLGRKSGKGFYDYSK